MAIIYLQTETDRLLLPLWSNVKRVRIELDVSSLHTEPDFDSNHLCLAASALSLSLKERIAVLVSDLFTSPFLFLFVIQGLAL